MTPRVKAASRGMTMIEVVVAMGILAMVAVLIHGVIDSLSRGKKAEGMRSDRAHEGREALQRIVRDLSSAYLSLHVPAVQALITSKTAFVGRSSIPFDRVDFTAFAHRRTERDSHESDQAEVGYFVVGDPDVPGQNGPRPSRADANRHRPAQGRNRRRGGRGRFGVSPSLPRAGHRAVGRHVGLDASHAASRTGCRSRSSIRLVLKGVGDGRPYAYTTKVMVPIQQPLSFGIPRQ